MEYRVVANDDIFERERDGLKSRANSSHPGANVVKEPSREDCPLKRNCAQQKIESHLV